MKKRSFSLLVSALLMFALPNALCAFEEPVNLHEGKVTPTHDDDNGRSVISIPTLYKDGMTLQFRTPCDGYTLRLVQNGQVQYMMVIPTNTHELVLPSTLSGEYQIQLVVGNIMFYGTINI